MTWLGHASVLAEVDGKTILTDPIFSYRASLVQVGRGGGGGQWTLKLELLIKEF